MHTLDNAFTASADFANTANWQGVDDEPTAGSDNLVKSGGILKYTSTLNIFAESSIIDGQYITWNGSIYTWGSSNIKLYRVDAGKSINIQGGKGRSTQVYKYAFYSSESIGIDTCILVSGQSIDEPYNDSVVVPAGATYLGVSVVDDAITTVGYLVSLGSDHIITRDKLNDTIFDTKPMKNSNKLIESGTLFNQLCQDDIYENINFDFLVQGKYISNGAGTISEYSSFNLKCYNVTPGQTIRIDRGHLASQGTARIYGFYNTSDSSLWSFSTAVLIASTTIPNGDVIIYLTVPQGAVCLVVCDYPNDNYYPVVKSKVEKTVNIQDFLQMQEDVEDIQNLVSKQVLFLDEPYEIKQGLYTLPNGNIASYDSYDLKCYNVTPGQTIRIDRGHLASQGAAGIYTIYNTSDSSLWSSSTAVLASSQNIYTGKINIDLTVPENGVILVITEYPREKYSPDLRKGTLQSLDLQHIQEIQEEVDAITSEITGSIYGLYPVWYTAQGKYISDNDGTISEYSSFTISVYSIWAGQRIRINRGTLPIQGQARIYGFYSSNSIDLMSPSTAIEISSQHIYQGDSVIYLIVPQGAQSLAVCNYPGEDYNPEVEVPVEKTVNIQDFLQMQEDVENIKNNIDIINSTLEHLRDFCVEFGIDNETLYIAYLDNSNSTEYGFVFKKCMANMLYTFERVGYHVVNRNYADTKEIKIWSNMITLNQSSSDNIGPLGFDDGGLVGGNHLWDNNYEINCKTAKNDSFSILVDGKSIAAGEKCYATKVHIKVVNTLYNPSETPVQGQDILTIPASEETVIYEIEKNNIFVSVRQKIASNNNNILNRYYGMQSMFNSETHVITPNGQYTDWTAAADFGFNKSDYPNFNRFIEKNDNAYQSAYLIPNKAGSHNLLGNDSVIFNHAGSKTYHHIFASGNFAEPTPGFQFAWSGIYTFFKEAIVDNSDVFAYKGLINGKTAIFINTKRQCSVNIDLPDECINKTIKQIEKSDTISTDNSFIDVDGLSIIATGIGSFIFTLE